MKNSKIVAIIKNDIERSIKNKWFVILNLLLLIITVVLLNFNSIKSLFLKEDETLIDNSTTIYVRDLENIAYDKIAKSFENDINVDVEKTENIEQYNNDNLDTNIILVDVHSDNVEYINASIIYKDGTSNDYILKIESTINSIKDTMISENKNLTLQEIEQIKQDVSIDINVIENTQNTANENGMYFISNYLILFILLLCLSKIANTISQEKMSKSIEYILTSITTKQYIISKVLSICFTVIIQFVFIVAYVIVALMISTLLNNVNVSGYSDVNNISLATFINSDVIIYFLMTIVFMCLTVFLQGVIQCIMSAKTTSVQEAGNATFLLITINLILYMAVTVFSSNTNIVGYIISVIPMASMYFIPSMYILGQANWLQIIIALIILIASVPLSLILAQKPFKNAILDFSPKKNKKIEGIEKILSTREYQERMIERKNSSKIGLVIGFAVILLIIFQVLGGIIVSVFLEGISNSITFISQSNIYLILSCFIFVISIYLPYLLLKSYIPKEERKNADEADRKINKESIIQCIKYIIVGIPIISIIQMICSFAIEKMGVGVDVTETLGVFNYSGVLSTILIFLQVAILPAIFEELFVRKGIIGVTKRKGAIFAVVVSSLIFATIHMNVSQFIFAFLVGILFGIIRVKTNKLYPTMVLHFINNGFAIIEALFYDHMIFMQIFTYFNILLNAVGFCLLIYMAYNKFMELKDKESIQKFKEKMDYRKIKLNLMENMYVFKDYTFLVTIVLCTTLFITIDKVLSIM